MEAGSRPGKFFNLFGEEQKSEGREINGIETIIETEKKHKFLLLDGWEEDGAHVQSTRLERE